MTNTPQRDIERELFEAVYTSAIWNAEEGRYERQSHNYAWLGWQARAAQATAEPDSDEAYILSALLWLYHRLPAGYARQAHIEAPINALATKLGIDVESEIATRIAAPDRAPSAAPLAFITTDGKTLLFGDSAHTVKDQATLVPLCRCKSDDSAAGWISVKDRLPEVGVGVMVYSPPMNGEGPEDYRIDFDCIDPDDDDRASWLRHNEHYEHFCCVAKPEGSTGPRAEAPYTHWRQIPAPPAIAA